MICFPSRYKWDKNLLLIFRWITEAHSSTPATLVSAATIPSHLPLAPDRRTSSFSFWCLLFFLSSLQFFNNPRDFIQYKRAIPTNKCLLEKRINGPASRLLCLHLPRRCDDTFLKPNWEKKREGEDGALCASTCSSQDSCKLFGCCSQWVTPHEAAQSCMHSTLPSSPGSAIHTRPPHPPQAHSPLEALGILFI